MTPRWGWVKNKCDFNTLYLHVAHESGYIQLLFEYRESKRCLRVNRSNVCETIEKELSRFGQTVSKVSLSEDCGSSNSLLLQKWCTAWDTYVDVETVDDVDDKDRVTVVRLLMSIYSTRYILCKSAKLSMIISRMCSLIPSPSPVVVQNYPIPTSAQAC